MKGVKDEAAYYNTENQAIAEEMEELKEQYYQLQEKTNRKKLRQGNQYFYSPKREIKRGGQILF